MDVTRCCKHTGRTPPTKQEQVLLLLGSIESTNSDLIANIVMVNSDPTGLGMCFENTATNLMLADPSVQQARKSKTGTSISSSLAGRGGTGVDLCWYPAKKFKELSSDQRDELMELGNSNEGKAVIKAGRAKAKAKRAADTETGKVESEVVVVTIIKLNQNVRRSTRNLLQRQQRNS